MKRIKNTVIAVLVFVFLILGCANAGIDVGMEKYYAIFWSDKLVGYSHFFVSQKVYLGEKHYYRIDSDSRLKVGMGGIEDVQFISDLFVEQDTLNPSSLNLLQQVGDMKINVHAVVSDTLVLQTDLAGKNKHDYYKEIKDAPTFFVNNFWGSFGTFAEYFQILALMTKNSDKKELSIYDPLMKDLQKINIVSTGPVTVKVKDKKYDCTGYDILDLNKTVKYRMFVDKKYNLIKVEQANGPVYMVLSNKGVVNEISKSKGTDLWDLRVADAKFVLPNAADLTYLKVKINTKVYGDVIRDYKDLGFSQKYYPGTEAEEIDEFDLDLDLESPPVPGKEAVKEETVEEVKEEVEKVPEDKNILDGVMEINTKDIIVNSSFKYPVTEDFPDDVLRYLEPEFGIECDNDRIRNKASYVVLNSKNIWDAAGKIFNFIKEEINIGPAMPSAKLTFASKQGNSESISMLFTAMCRSVGIPARLISGLIYSGGKFVPHTWIECYTGKEGWAALDPTLGEFDKLSASHIALWHNGDIRYPHVQILDYAPNPSPRVPYFRNEVKWPLGEERVYKITKNEQELGKEVVALKELSIQGDKETYEFDSLTEVDNGLMKTEIKTKYYLTPYGLPVYYNLEIKEDKDKLVEECNFKRTFITKSAKLNDQSKEISLPISDGAYLADKRVLSQICVALGQIPEVKLGKTYKLYLFYPDELKTEAVDVKIDNVEYLNIKGEKVLALVGVSENLYFWIDKDGRVLKLDFPKQNVIYELESYKSILQK
ncbi:MAG: transglutaminase-like domain-containing protein [Armatimonadota bacterium]